ncbi:uncharacterized protein LOC143886163 [Tasmannia lanceolata]|uniref:uncharacterized protein LOC143886163 n=1 Tax=Tasmannia lanceolata TaxID=3420 RepID=UPI004063887D
MAASLPLNPEAQIFTPQTTSFTDSYLPLTTQNPYFSPHPLHTFSGFPLMETPQPLSIYNNNLFVYVGLPWFEQPNKTQFYGLCDNVLALESSSSQVERNVIPEVEEQEGDGVRVRGRRRVKRREEGNDQGHETKGKKIWKAKEGKGGNSDQKIQAQSLGFGDGMTTLMIKNIPNKYTKEMLVDFLDQHCLEENNKIMNIEEEEEAKKDFFSAYDFVYLPIDFRSGCNLGYAFVNFTDPRATILLRRVLHHHKWAVLGSKKICEISYARIQGRDALEKHFEKSNFACESEEFLPECYTPYRNGSCPYQSRTLGKLWDLNILCK